MCFVSEVGFDFLRREFFGGVSYKVIDGSGFIIGGKFRELFYYEVF